jgi:hypothetical protein
MAQAFEVEPRMGQESYELCVSFSIELRAETMDVQ